MTHVFDDAETLIRREVWQGSVGRFGEEDIRLPDDRRLTLAILRHPGACAVVPLLPGGRVVLLRQYRHAVAETLWEIPAGKLDRGESVESCAARELREETGYRAERFIPLGSLCVTPGYSDERIHLFAACDLTPGAQSLESNESITCSELPFHEALRLAEDGTISDAKTAIALFRARRYVSE
ncbi:MAG: NUDIX hydrolase [Polyangiales bacterium]